LWTLAPEHTDALLVIC